jgi:hypothetical protein
VNGPRRIFRAGVLFASAALLVPAALLNAAPAAAQRADTFTMTIDRITPWTPTPTQHPSQITVELTLTSSTPQPDVRVIGERGDPIENQSALDNAIANRSRPSASGLPIPAHPEVKLSLEANTPTPVTFTTTTSTQDDGSGICLCASAAIYPLLFSAHVNENGVDQQLGVAATYLPAFYPEGFGQNVIPVRVSWLWPLLDRPHRLTSDTVFTDDDLAAELAPDGRLDRALQVVENVGDSIPLTLVVDPEVLDEIWVMAHKPYQVRDGTNLIAGTGKDAAAAWLDRLRNTLSTDTQVEVELTPFADPNVQAITAAGRTWRTSLPSTAMAQEVSDALGGRALDSTLAWPAKGAIDRTTLAALDKDGVSTVVLNSSAVTPRLAKGAVPAGLARLRTGGTDVAAALTSSTLERFVARNLTASDGTSSTLPQLLSELAVRAAQEPDVKHAVVLSAPRYVDPDVTAAVETIRETSNSKFAKPIALRAAVLPGALLPTNRSGLAPVPSSAANVSDPAFDAATNAAVNLPAIRSMLDTKHDLAARAFVQSLPIAIQRAESAAWADETQAGAAGGYADELNRTVDDTISGVRIVQPSSRSYTLASNNSPLPITIDNELPYAVNVQISINTIPPKLPGFSTSRIGVQHVDSKQKRTVKIPTTIERSGRIRITAVLLPPNGTKQLGGTQELTVRSTALGTVGVIITITAGIALALALLVRFGRRLRSRRANGAEPLPPVQVDEPEPAT